MIDAALYKISYVTQGGELKLHVLGRDTNGKRVDKYITGVRPYFYVPIEDAERAAAMSEVVEVLPGPVSTDGRQMVQVFTKYPFTVAEIKTRFQFHCEADIVFANRTRVDHQLSYVRFENDSDTVHISRVKPLDKPPHFDPRICYIDIETDDSNGFADPKDPTNEITAVSVYDSGKNAYACIYTGADVDVEILVKHLPKPLLGSLYLFPVKNEHDLIGALGMLLAKAQPDIVAAWNGHDYDYPYLANRAKIYWNREQANEDLGLVVNSFDEGARRSHGSFAVVDPMRVYMKQELAQRAHSLQAVGMDMLGYGKLPRENSVSELRRKDFPRFLAYNIWDSHLMRMIDLHPKGRLIPYFIDIAMMNGVELEDCYFNSRVVDGALLIEARNTPNRHPYICLPSKQFAPGHGLRVGKAAEVFPTITGTFRFVIALDLAQEYPSVVLTLNISPETKRLHAIPGETFDIPGGGHYLKGNLGIVPRIVVRFREFRNNAKAEASKFRLGSSERTKADTVSTAIKFVVNSIAGVFDDPYWRLADVDIFEDITRVSRLQLRWNRDHLTSDKWLTEVLGYPARGKVILGDTDSCYVEISRLRRNADGTVTAVPLSEFDDAEFAGKMLKDALNASYAEFYAQMGVEKHYTEVDFEGMFGTIRTLALAHSDGAAKKRYYGIYDFHKGKDVRPLSFEDRKKISGIEYKRFNVSPLTKKVQLGVIERYLTGRSSEIKAFITEIQRAALAGEIDDAMLVPAKMSKSEKSLPWNTAAKNFGAVSGAAARDGDAFRWAYVRSVHYKGTSHSFAEFAIPFLDTLKEHADAGLQIQIDRPRMFQKTVKDPLSLVYPEYVGVQESLEARW